MSADGSSMMFVALAVGLLWIFGCLLAVVLCVASRRIDEDLATGQSRPPRRRRGATRTQRVRTRLVRLNQKTEFG